MAIKPYDHTTYPSNGALGSSAALRNELDTIEAGFDMVATEIERALTGSKTAAATATTQAGIATTQAGIATTQAELATTNGAAQVALATSQAGIATTQAGIATTQAGIATTQASNALDSANSAAATLATVNTVYDNFDDRYLGTKSSAPTLDNDGNALQVGTLYWDSTLNTLRGYNGTSWVDLPATTASGMSNTPSGNLSATNVQAALDELQSDIDGRELSIHAATEKVTPLNADTMGLIDSAAVNVLKKVTWSNIKATLKAYFDTLYIAAGSVIGLTDGDKGDITVSGSGAIWTIDSNVVSLNKLARVGTAGQFLQSQGVGEDPAYASIPAVIGTLIGYQVFTASGTYSKSTNNPSFVIVEVVGGGGGGGGAQNAGNAGSGGGAGGYSFEKILASLLASSETVTIGGAGTAGSTAGGNGGDGGTSSFGAFLTATGGSGGTGTTTSGVYRQGAAGGIGSGGSLNLRGGGGGTAIVNSAAAGSSGGMGGSSRFSGGGAGRAGSAGAGTAAGSNTGGGGGGANGSASAGGAGGSGLVIVWEYA